MLLVVPCRLKSCMCSYSRQKLIVSSWDRSSSRREKLGRAWRVLLKTCKPSWRCRPTAAILETPRRQTWTPTDRPHSTPMDPKVAHSLKKNGEKDSIKRSMVKNFVAPPVREKRTKLKVSFVDEKNLSYIIRYDINQYYYDNIWIIWTELESSMMSEHVVEREIKERILQWSLRWRQSPRLDTCLSKDFILV